jgi:hypothetical protein
MAFAKAFLALCLLTSPLVATGQTAAPDAPAAKPAARAKKVEGPVTLIPASTDPAMGDWQGDGGVVAQVYTTIKGDVEATLLKSFDTEKNSITILKGTRTGDTLTFSGDGWTASLQNAHFTGSKGDQKFDLQHITRTSPTIGAQPPKGAVILFDGHNMEAWAKKNGKDWLAEDGPSKWKILDDGSLEVVPGADCIITHQKFGDCHLHVEFRTLGLPTNSGVFIETRYEANINETYGRTDGDPNGGFDNCTDAIRPKIRPCYPPLAWQTFDIDFTAPRFEGGKKTAPAKATVLFNGVKIYDNQTLDPPHLAAGRLGEAPTGPLMLQEHGMPVQFRNIWLVEPKAGSQNAMNTSPALSPNGAANSQ